MSMATTASFSGVVSPPNCCGDRAALFSQPPLSVNFSPRPRTVKSLKLGTNGIFLARRVERFGNTGRSVVVRCDASSSGSITQQEFTEMAWQAIVSSPQVAKENKHQIVETEHLMKSLLEQKNGLARRIFSKAGVDNTRLLDATVCPNMHSVPSKAKASLNESRLQFLEERDEEILSKRILKLSRSNKIRSALELYRSMNFSGLKPNSHACNSLLSCLLRAKRIDDVLTIFEFMKVNQMTTGHSYSLILKGIAEARGGDSALHIFEEIVENSDLKKDLDAIVFNTMITVIAKENNWFQIERIWRSMKDNGLIGTTVTYRLLICSFVRCGQNELALDAYHEMVQNGLKPADDAMQAIIGACVKEGKWDLALSVFHDMLNSGMKPTAVTCNTLINSLGKVGKVNLAFKVYGRMESLGHVPDAYTWNALIGALCRGNQHADALQFFKSIQLRKSAELNIHVYNSALMSCQRLGLWDKALQVLWQMEASGLSISTVSYNLVIGACEVARKPKTALQVYKHMVHKKHTPDTFTRLSLLRCCIWGSLWNEVDKILDDSPNVSSYNAAIQGLCLRGRIDSARKHYAKMRKISLKPDGKTRALMLQNLPER